LSATFPSSLPALHCKLHDCPSVQTLAPPVSSANSYGIISFAGPHPLTSIESYRYKNIAGGVCPWFLAIKRSNVQTFKRANGCSSIPCLFIFFLTSLRNGHRVSAFRSIVCALFCALLHFLALTQNSTLLFSASSALFAQKRELGRPRKADHSAPIPHFPSPSPFYASLHRYLITSILFP
jgi:hypothetical protein